jgi:hypothetical protein
MKNKNIIPKEESTLVDKLKEYFNTTSKEQIQKDWEETCKQTEGIISPTVDEFIKAQEIFIKQETLEEAAKRLYPLSAIPRKLWLEGAKYQQEQDKNMYSEEEVLEFANWCRIEDNKHPNRVITIQQLFEQFKKK